MVPESEGTGQLNVEPIGTIVIPEKVAGVKLNDPSLQIDTN